MIQQRRFDAIIFDHDGTLVDTETSDLRACQTLYEELNVPFDPQRWGALVAGSIGGYDILLAEVAEAHGNGLTTADVWKRLRELWEITYEQVELAPGAKNLLPQLQEAGYPLGVASASDIEWVMRWLTTFNLLPYFQIVAGSDNVVQVKPAPDVYLYAADKLGVAPERCLAFEDSVFGVTAAKAAGMTVVAVPSHITQHLDFSHADVVIEGLQYVTLDWLDKLAQNGMS